MGIERNDQESERYLAIVENVYRARRTPNAKIAQISLYFAKIDYYKSRATTTFGLCSICKD